MNQLASRLFAIRFLPASADCVFGRSGHACLLKAAYRLGDRALGVIADAPVCRAPSWPKPFVWQTDRGADQIVRTDEFSIGLCRIGQPLYFCKQELFQRRNAGGSRQARYSRSSTVKMRMTLANFTGRKAANFRCALRSRAPG